MDFVVRNLVEFKPEKVARDLNECDVPSTGLVESETFLKGLDVDFVKKCCAILSYQLRLKHPICLPFDVNVLSNDASREAYSLFWSIDNFSTYIDECTTFAEVFRDCNERVATLFRDETISKSRSKSNEDGLGTNGRLGKRKRDTLTNDERRRRVVDDEVDDDNNDEDEDDLPLDDLETILDQYQSMQKIFGAFIDMFLDKNFDRYVIYKRFFLDFCLSEAIPLTLTADVFVDLRSLFAHLLRFTIHSTDFCNTQMSAFFGPGMMINMLLYLTSSDMVNDALAIVNERKERKRMKVRAKDETTKTETTINVEDETKQKTSTPLVTHWTRLTIRDRDDYDSAFLLRDIDNDDYRRCVASLSPDEFSAEMGHVFMSKGDTLSTIFMQFVSRLYRRLLEWPERSDVKIHLEQFFQCDNIATFFAQSGRQNQNWIRFFKRRPKDNVSMTGNVNVNNSSSNCDSVISTSNNKVNETSSSGFVNSRDHDTDGENRGQQRNVSDTSANEMSRKRGLPLVYINIERLHALYDSLSYGVPAAQPSANKRPRLDGVMSSGSTKLVAQDASVKNTWDSLGEFKKAYVDFFIKGCSRDDSYRRWFVQCCTDFVLRSGGFRSLAGLCSRQHSRDIEMCFEDGYIRFRDCRQCTLSLYREKDAVTILKSGNVGVDLDDSIFTFNRWADEINGSLFPYNFVMSSVAYINNGRKFDDETLRQAWILKAQEVLVTRKFTADKCRKCLLYFEKLEKISRFVVEESNLKKIFASLLKDLPFLQNFFDDDPTADSSETFATRDTNLANYSDDDNDDAMDCD